MKQCNASTVHSLRSGAAFRLPAGVEALDHEPAERGRDRLPIEGDADRGCTVTRERVVPDAEMQLVIEVPRMVHEGCGAQQERLASDEPGCQRLVAPNGGVPEVVALVHDHQVRLAGWEAPK